MLVDIDVEKTDYREMTRAEETTGVTSQSMAHVAEDFQHDTLHKNPCRDTACMSMHEGASVSHKSGCLQTGSACSACQRRNRDKNSNRSHANLSTAH